MGLGLNCIWGLWLKMLGWNLEIWNMGILVLFFCNGCGFGIGCCGWIGYIFLVGELFRLFFIFLIWNWGIGFEVDFGWKLFGNGDRFLVIGLFWFCMLM